MTLIPDWNLNNPVTYARMRQTMLDGALQEGVVGATDLKVVQRGAGANQSVDVGAGFAWVQIDTGTRNGLGHVTNDATANVTVTASDATNPRIDQIILRWNDTSIPTGSGNVPTLAVLSGTATSGATLDNRTGAAALPNDCLRLADILVPAASTSVTTANIRDRRPWARGAFRAVTQSATTDLVVSATTYAARWSWTSPRIECSGAPLLITISFNAGNSTTAGTLFATPATYGTADATIAKLQAIAATSDVKIITATWFLTPTSGSHTFDVYTRMGSGNCTLFLSNANGLPQLTIQEIVRPNAENT